MNSEAQKTFVQIFICIFLEIANMYLDVSQDDHPWNS